MATYILSELGRTITWMQWIRAKGCNLSHTSAADVMTRIDLAKWQRRGHLLLGDIASASRLADRELARYARQIGREAWTVVEPVTTEQGA